MTRADQCRPYVRTEHDLLGDRDVPADVYYGVHTARALENFPISGVPISRHRDLVVALASVKQAAAQANRSSALLDAEQRRRDRRRLRGDPRRARCTTSSSST